MSLKCGEVHIQRFTIELIDEQGYALLAFLARARRLTKARSGIAADYFRTIREAHSPGFSHLNCQQLAHHLWWPCHRAGLGRSSSRSAQACGTQHLLYTANINAKTAIEQLSFCPKYIRGVIFLYSA